MFVLDKSPRSRTDSDWTDQSGPLNGRGFGAHRAQDRRSHATGNGGHQGRRWPKQARQESKRGKVVGIVVLLGAGDVSLCLKL